VDTRCGSIKPYLTGANLGIHQKGNAKMNDDVTIEMLIEAIMELAPEERSELLALWKNR